MPKTVIVHTVLTTFYISTPEEMRRDILDRFQKLGEKCGGKAAGILGWTVRPNLDLSKKKHIDLVQNAVFEDAAAFQAFRKHSEHVTLREELRDYADWISGNLLIDRQAFKEMLKSL